MKQGLFFLLLILHLILLSNLSFTAWPEMLSYPYFYLNKFKLYQDFVMPYPPVLIWILAFFYKVFGTSVLVLRSFTWGMVLVNDLILFLILRKINLNFFSRIVILMFFILTATFLDGNMLWFDNASVTPLLVYIFFVLSWLKERNKRSIFFAGILLGITIEVKQTALIYLLAFGFFWFVNFKINLKDLKFFALGILTAIFPVTLYILVKNSYTEFFYWVFYNPVKYWSSFPGYVEFNLVKEDLTKLFLLSLPLLLSFFKYKVFSKLEYQFLLLTLAASLIAVYPRFSYFHLQPAIAVLVVLIGIVTKEINQKNREFILAALVLIACLVIYPLRSHLGNKEIRFYATFDQRLSREIKRVIEDNEQIYLLGVNSSQYFFTQTYPPKPWVDNFLWYMEIPGVQEKVIEGLMDVRTVFVKRIPDGEWYELEVYQPKKVKDYIYNNYELSGIIEDNIEIWQKER